MQNIYCYLKGLLDFIDGQFDINEKILQWYLSVKLRKDSIRVYEQPNIKIIQCSYGHLPTTGWNNPKPIECNIKPDLIIKDEDDTLQIFELKVIKYDELSRSKNIAYKYIYSCQYYHSIASDVLIYSNINHSDKLDNKYIEAKPIMIVRPKFRFLTFFHEGQIWNDLIRLLSIKQQAPEYKDSKLYMAGLIKNYVNNKICFTSKAQIERKFIDILYYIILHAKLANKKSGTMPLSSTYGPVRVLNYFKRYKANKIEVRAVEANVPRNINFDIWLSFNRSKSWIGYVISIKNNAEQIAPADRQSAALLGGS